MTFKEASNKDFPKDYKIGLQAVKGNDRNKFDFIKNTRNINGSIDIDKSFKHEMQYDNRWDYVIGYNELAYFFEVHPMTVGEITDKMINKVKWLENILSKKAQNINSLKQYPLFWISTNAGDQLKITPKSKYWKMLTKMRIDGAKQK